MPDMQTALRSALSNTLQQWDDDGEEANPSPSVQPVSTSVSAPSQTIPVTKDHTMLNLHKITNNVSRVTFNYVRDNPGSTRMEIIKALGYQGFGKGSVSSLLAQMRRSYMVHETNGLWYADINEYVPIKNANYKKKKSKSKLGKVLAQKIAAPAKPVVNADAGIAALREEAPAPRSFLTKLVRTQTPEEIIGNMTVYQARELYVHLKQMFGG